MQTTLANVFSSRLFQFFVMDIPDLLHKTKNGNVSIIMMTDRYLKMTGEVPTSKTTATHFPKVFLNHDGISYVIPDHVLTDSGPQFVSKLCRTSCGSLGLKIPTAPA